MYKKYSYVDKKFGVLILGGLALLDFSLLAPLENIPTLSTLFNIVTISLCFLTYLTLSTMRIKKELAWVYFYFFIFLLLNIFSVAWSVSYTETLKFTILIILPLIFLTIFYSKVESLFYFVKKILDLIVISSFASMLLSVLINGYGINDYVSSEIDIQSYISPHPFYLFLGVALNIFQDKKLSVFNYVVIFMSLLLLVQLPSKSYLLSTILACSFAHIFFRRSLLSFSVLSVFLVFFTLYVLSFENFISESFFYTPVNISNFSSESIDTSGRINTWTHLINLVNESSLYPLIGMGAGTSNYIMASTYHLGTSVHSEYIRIFVEYGIFGLIFIYGGILFFSLKNRENSNIRSSSNKLLQAILFFYLLIGITYVLSNFFIPFIFMVILTILYVKKMEKRRLLK